jgi:hypothetical protein
MGGEAKVQDSELMDTYSRLMRGKSDPAATIPERKCLSAGVTVFFIV